MTRALASARIERRAREGAVWDDGKIQPSDDRMEKSTGGWSWKLLSKIRTRMRSDCTATLKGYFNPTYPGWVCLIALSYEQVDCAATTLRC